MGDTNRSSFASDILRQKKKPLFASSSQSTIADIVAVLGLKQKHCIYNSTQDVSRNIVIE